jgi:2-methylisocitrate lyase-like PEP mutase family enzyme
MAGGPVTGRLTRRRGGSGAPARLRELLNSGQTVVAPGAFDPLAARLVEEAGFAAAYMTGFGTSAALLGRPDVGLLTMTEMADSAGRIAACVDIPLIVDADTGYGNPLNVIRTAGADEAAGVAGLHTPAALLGELPTFGEFTDFIGLPEVPGIEQRYIARES